MTNRSGSSTSVSEQTKVSSPAAAGAVNPYPHSVLLHYYGKHEGEGSTGEPETMAAACSTAGHPFRISFQLAPPPEVSRILVGFPADAGRPVVPAGAEERKTHGRPQVLAAHGDSVLFKMSFHDRPSDTYSADHFLYTAGAAGRRPPAVLLLPRYYLSEEELEERYRYSCRRDLVQVQRMLDIDATGLWREEDEFVVAELKMVRVSADAPPAEKTAEIQLLRPSGERTVLRFTADVTAGGFDWKALLSKWKTERALPLSRGVLCWVDRSSGLLLYNVLHEGSRMAFLPFPLEPSANSSVSITAGGGALKLVDVCPRCCCGAKGTTSCHRAYTIRTWIVRIGGDMEWEMDGMVDSTEIWALDAYEGLPRVQPVCPIASVDDPDVVCFQVSERNFVRGGTCHAWLLMLDLRRKTIVSTCHSGDGGYEYPYNSIFPSKLSDYFNPYPTSVSSRNGSSSDTVAPPVTEVQGSNDGRIRDTHGPCKILADAVVQVSDVLAVLQEIPTYGFTHQDMVKAVSILSRDNGRRFKSILELPVSMRRDWLLMEIKTSES